MADKFLSKAQYKPESDIENIKYFREYALPTLTDHKLKDYVIVQTMSNDPEQEVWSVLIKKEDYNKANEGKLQHLCSKYVDYTPDLMKVTILEETDREGGRFKHITIDKDNTGVWMKNTEFYYVRSVNSLEREKDLAKATKKIIKETQE